MLISRTLRTEINARRYCCKTSTKFSAKSTYCTANGISHDSMLSDSSKIEDEKKPALQRMTQDSLYSQYKHVFEPDIGTLGEPIHLDMDNSVKPVQQPVRRLPIAKKHKLKLELDRFEKLNVIQGTVKPTD